MTIATTIITITIIVITITIITRPQVGICVQITSEEGKKALLEHNRRFSAGEPFLPAIKERATMYGSLAGSHLNLALRILQGNSSSPLGDLSSLIAGDTTLKEVVMNGHLWHVLREDLTHDEQVEISLWRNQDQNENQGTNEVEILQTIQATALAASKSTLKLKMGDLIAKALKRNPAKISQGTVCILAKYYVQFLDSGDQFLINELVDFHSAKINPGELVVATNYFGYLVADDVFLKAPLLRHYLLLTQYTTEKCKTGASGGASFAQFLDQSSIVALGKKTEQVVAVEEMIRGIRAKLLSILQNTFSEKQARLELAVYMDLIIRCLMAKQWPEHLKAIMSKVLVGKFSLQKVHELGVVWAKHLDDKFPMLDFASASGLVDQEAIGDQGDVQEVELGTLRVLKPRTSEPSGSGDLDQINFKKGDQVIFSKRATWVVPVDGPKGKKEFRKEPWPCP
jgi:hypothetical protein